MKRPNWALVLGLLAALAFPLALRSGGAQAPPQFGEPLPGLPEWAVAAFQNGRARFTTVESPATGLGPVFNAKSCAACHSHPTTGGSGLLLENRVTRFGRQIDGHPFDPLLSLGGPNLQRFSVATELPACQLAGEAVPPEANVTGQRQPPPLFGLGLIETIPDSAILAHADPEDANGDGVAGRANINAGVIGRFGWKATSPTILHFVGLALVNELGVTNHVFPNEMAPQGQPIPPGCKITPDVEDADASRLSGDLSFVKFLGTPPRGPITEAVLRGEALFTEIGCALCHVPSMKTAPNPIEALNQKDVPLYSDLLTHYMGGGLDDHIPEGAAGGGRWRTPPLWGVRVRTFFLHDGRASDLVTAIRLHGGEAGSIRNRFLALPPQQRADLLAFLQSL